MTEKIFTIVRREEIKDFKIMPYINGEGSPNSGLISLCYCRPEYNSCSIEKVYHLSEKFRIGIKHSEDAIHTINCELYPGEIIDKVTLFTIQAFPKDKKLREAHLNGTLKDNSWMFSEKTCKRRYIPIKTVYNVTGPFTFYKTPIFLSPYNPLSIEVTYGFIKIMTTTGTNILPFDTIVDKKNMINKRKISIESFILSPELRNELFKRQHRMQK